MASFDHVTWIVLSQSLKTCSLLITNVSLALKLKHYINLKQINYNSENVFLNFSGFFHFSFPVRVLATGSGRDESH